MSFDWLLFLFLQTNIFHLRQHRERFYDEFVCTLCMVKNTDKNIFDGHRGFTFKVRAELLSMECKVEMDSTYICRNVLSVLKKRRVLLTNLDKVNCMIQKIIHSKKSSAIPLPVNLIPTPCSDQPSHSQVNK